MFPTFFSGNLPQKPHPRAAYAASPSPWERGVNGLANHRPTLICHPKILRSFANHSRTVASVPRPPATHSLLIFFRMEDGLCWGAGGRITLLAGGRGTETTVLLGGHIRLAKNAHNHIVVLCWAIVVEIVGQLLLILLFNYCPFL